MTARNLAAARIPQGVLSSMDALLFSNGERGAWFDPSDMSTLFQDAAGTVPVTAVEQPVGKILDKSGRGNHATQATTTKRPVLSARVNLVDGSELWNKLNGQDGSSTITAETVDIPPFVTASSVSKVTRTGVITNFYQYGTGQPLISGAINVRSFFVKPDANCATIGLSNSGTDPFFASYNLITKVLTVGANAGSASVIDQGNGWFKFSVTEKVASAISSGLFLIISSPINTGLPAAFLTTGYDTRVADQRIFPYQRVGTSTDYDSNVAKFPRYLKFDGIDDSLVTGNIDFSNTDKISVFSGVRVLSTATSILAETSASYSGSAGAFELSLGEISSGAATLAFRGPSGTHYMYEGAQTVPRSVVISGSMDGAIAAPGAALVLRTNAANAQSSGGITEVLSAFGNYPLNIGNRGADPSYGFSGCMFDLVVRGGRSTPGEVAAAEHLISKKMGVRL